MKQRFYGYKPSSKDDRDFLYKSVRQATPLPPFVDLRSFCSPVRDQQSLGSCTGESIVAMREFLEIRNTKKLTKLSPLFVYYEERVLEGTVNEDAGAEPRDGFKTLVNLGVAPESTDKYVASKFAKAPTKTAITDALKYRISSYHSLSSLADIQSCLVSGTGVVIGFNVYESFEGDDIANTGIMPMPTSGEKIIGGHAVFVCSYFTDVTFPGGGYLVIKNSWGTSWGGPMKGYFKMPFLFVNSTNVSDMWTCSL